MDAAMNLTFEDVAEKIRAFGTGSTWQLPGDIYRFYLARLKAVPRDGIEVTRDLSYGPDPRHLLDLHVPAGRAEQPRPTVIFFHGGGFTRGTKNKDGGVIYGNVADHFARNGIIGINATYRLAPEHQWPSGALDVGAAVRWARANVSAHGGDAGRIFVAGHSSGASHVAAYALCEEFHPSSGPDVAGVIAISGRYGPDARDRDRAQAAYYGDDASLYPAMGALGRIAAAKVPVFVVMSEFEPYPFHKAGLALAAELAERDRMCPWLKIVRGHSHFTQILTIDSGEPALGPDLVAFVRARV